MTWDRNHYGFGARLEIEGISKRPAQLTVRLTQHSVRLIARPPSDVSLYFDSISVPVWRMVSIAASRGTKWVPSPFSAREAAVRRWAAVVFAFVGVLLVARPGAGVLGWSALLPFGAAVLLGVYMVTTRIIRTNDDPDATIFYSTALGTLVLSALVPFHWQALTPFQWGLMATMGMAGSIGHYLLVKAFHSAEASFLAPFTYFQVVAAILWGFLVFGDVPSIWTLGGATVIIGSGIYVWYRESRLQHGQPEAIH